MRKLVYSIAVLGLLGSAGTASAGCLMGAAAGAVAGHMAGHHGMMGAAAGCAVGHHMKKKKAMK